MDILINQCYGGFGLSNEACELLGFPKYVSEFDKELHYEYSESKARTDPRVIALYKEKGSKFMSGEYAELALFHIPDNATDYEIYEYDGYECVTYVVNNKLFRSDDE